MSGHPQADQHQQPRVRTGRHLTLADELTPTWATLAASDLVEAVDTLDGEGPLELHARPGAVELTSCLPGGAVWETALVSAQVAPELRDRQRRTTIERRSLLGTLQGADGATELRLAPNGAMTAGGVVLAPVREAFPEPPRPSAGQVLSERLALPRSAGGMEMILRLEGPNVCIPEVVRERFGHRLVSSVSLFEEAGEWFISGVRNGSPTLILVGAVGVY